LITIEDFLEKTRRTRHALLTVLSLTLNNRAISEIARPSSSRMRRASVFCAGVRAGGRPPTHPRAFAACKPSFVRSEIPPKISDVHM